VVNIVLLELFLIALYALVAVGLSPLLLVVWLVYKVTTKVVLVILNQINKLSWPFRLVHFVLYDLTWWPRRLTWKVFYSIYSM
jgi:hypothetical protein